jgi:site-specific recombinase XerD
MTNSLEPLDPRTAKQMYLDDRRNEVADATVQAHDYRLEQFVRWCEEQDITNLNTLTGRLLHRFRVKRKNEDELATATMKGQLATLRMFVRFCVTIDAIETKLDEKILLPTTTKEDARTEMLDAETAEQVLDYLQTYQYASLEHVLLKLIYHTGVRIGSARCLDIGDYNAEEQFIDIVHRPDQDTPLKNGNQGERMVALSENMNCVLSDWVTVNKPDIIDDYGRHPLFATNHGRVSRNRARSIAYQYTRPCVYDECPHGRNQEECDAMETSRAYACPSSLSPHPIRRGAITYHLKNETPERVVSDRMDVGMDILDRHYDQRSKQEKLRQRRQYLPD